MSHTVLNVVLHQGGGCRLGVICREFLLEPQPNHIIINGINDNPIIIPARNYYLRHGSIVHSDIIEWLGVHFPRTAADNIWLLKFDFEVVGDSHVFSYVGPSNYKKIPHRREIIEGQHNVVRYHTYEELIQIVWNR